TNQAAWIVEPKSYPFVIKASPMPAPKEGEVAIRVHAVGINIVDNGVQKRGIWAKPEDYPTILGSDVAGIVTEVGPGHTRFTKGDRVVASVSAVVQHDSRHGGFQLHTTAVEPLIAKLPDNIDFTDAAVLPLPFITAIYSLFMKETLGLDLPKAGTQPKSTGKTLVVWGGSSAVGMNAIQTAKAAGYTVAATSSPHNFDVLKALGADYTFDYHQESAVDDIVSTLSGHGDSAGVFAAMLGLDFSTMVQSLLKMAGLAGKLGGKKHLATVVPPGILPPLPLPEGVEMSFNTCRDVARSETGQAIWVDWVPGALADGSLKCKPEAQVVGRGLESVQEVVDLLAKGVSARKLVVDL
ncbi:chaperonin 10-like protein, partial [Coniella lustricola]